MILPLLKGLKLTFRTFFTRPVTLKYPEQKMAMDQPQTQPVAPPIRPRNVFQQGAPGGKYLTPQARRKRDMVMALLASPTPALPVTKTRTYSAMRV